MYAAFRKELSQKSSKIRQRMSRNWKSFRQAYHSSQNVSVRGPVNEIELNVVAWKRNSNLQINPD